MTIDTKHLRELAEAATPEAEWRDVVGYEGYYEVSSTGLVRGKDRVVFNAAKGDLRIRGRMLTIRRSTKRGYALVKLTRNRVGKHAAVHRLVAQAFIPNPQNLPMVLHWDDDPLNNHVENLRWGTGFDNMKDRERNGTAGLRGRRGTHCINGHEYTKANTYQTKTGRRCRTCSMEGQRRRYQERRGEK